MIFFQGNSGNTPKIQISMKRGHLKKITFHINLVEIDNEIRFLYIYYIQYLYIFGNQTSILFLF